MDYCLIIMYHYTIIILKANIQKSNTYFLGISDFPGRTWLQIIYKCQGN